MSHEIHPEPSLPEREAIEEALARVETPPDEPRTAWWRAGLAELISEEGEPA